MRRPMPQVPTPTAQLSIWQRKRKLKLAVRSLAGTSWTCSRAGGEQSEDRRTGMEEENRLKAPPVIRGEEQARCQRGGRDKDCRHDNHKATDEGTLTTSTIFMFSGLKDQERDITNLFDERAKCCALQLGSGQRSEQIPTCNWTHKLQNQEHGKASTGHTRPPYLWDSSDEQVYHWTLLGSYSRRWMCLWTCTSTACTLLKSAF